MHCLRGPAQRWRSVGVRPPRRRGAPPRAEPNGGGPPGGGGQQPPPPPSPALPPLGELWTSLLSVASPYWQDPAESGGARLRLGGVVALSLATTAASVGFNFLGRDFFNAIAAKDEPAFHSLLLAYLGAIAGAVPLFVLRDYQQSLLALRWREWLTERYLGLYLGDRAFFRLAADGSVDNPDQRLNADVGACASPCLKPGRRRVCARARVCTCEAPPDARAVVCVCARQSPARRSAWPSRSSAPPSTWPRSRGACAVDAVNAFL